MVSRKNIPLFWGLFSFEFHFEPHPYSIVYLDRLPIFINWNNKLGRTSPETHQTHKNTIRSQKTIDKG
jgi:hypothetical protein